MAKVTYAIRMDNELMKEIRQEVDIKRDEYDNTSKFITIASKRELKRSKKARK
jgi:hypothetical protein